MIGPENCRMMHYPDSLLAKPAEPVGQIDDNLRQIADRMIDLMLGHKGIGLAGPQANIPKRIFVISMDGTKQNARVYINPTINPSGELEPMEEGCLSLPGVFTKVRRYKKCAVTATALDGKEFTEEAEGLLARAFQHECDHLDGRLIIDRIGQIAKIAVRDRLKELRELYKKGETGR